MNSPLDEPNLVQLDGFHALKHAIRFGATIVSAQTDRYSATLQLAARLAPDCVPWLESNLLAVDSEALGSKADRHPTRVLSFAQRPTTDMNALAASKGAIVVLEDPRHLGNVGAAVRVAAGLSASALVTTGPIDPWAPESIRGGAGLQFALPVIGGVELADLDALRTSRPMLGLDPDGDSIFDLELPPNPMLCFGTERDGLSDELLQLCAQRVSLPMRAGVSSLNLATSVSATLLYFNARLR